jgi:alkylation response protein AidB-like acyl-CoA dehydrogenase
VSGGLRDRCVGLFDQELAPVLRRLGQRATGAGDASHLAPSEEATREAVWAALVDAGLLQAARPPAAQAELIEVAELFGAALYQSPLPDTVTAMDLLASTGEPAFTVAIEELASGHQAAALAIRGSGGDEPSALVPVTVDQPAKTVSGTRAFVPFAKDVAYLLVIGTAGGRALAALVPAHQPGVAVRRHDDVGRGDLYAVRLERAVVAGRPAEIGGCYPDVLARARIRHAAYLAGSARGALELAVSRLGTRTAFGQPLARFQALAFRVAALRAELAAALAFIRVCAARADAGDDVRAAAAQALLVAANAARATAEESVHLHGSLGLTEGCDAQLFYRRAAVDGAWLGTLTALRQEAASLLTQARWRTPAPGPA